MFRGSGEKVMGIDSSYGGLLYSLRERGGVIPRNRGAIRGQNLGVPNWAYLRPKLILWRLEAIEF